MSTQPTPIRTAVERTHLRLSPTVLGWLDDIAREDAAPGERVNRAATMRRLIREERARKAAEKGAAR